MNKIIEIKHIADYKLWIRFNDGESRIINFKNLIGEGISSKLLDTGYFQQVTIDNGGGIEWPNGFDFCPNYLKDYSEVVKSESVTTDL
jgi:hypothetical protein